MEKLDEGIKEAKRAADESSQHGSQAETLQRRLQLLEEEAEEADRNLRETNEKYVCRLYWWRWRRRLGGGPNLLRPRLICVALGLTEGGRRWKTGAYTDR